jgi:mono/diheme cytochrome c family protein
MTRFATSLIAFGLLTTMPAMAAKLDPAPGQLIAKQWCAGCHAIRDKQTRSPMSGVRSFATIAQDPASTEMALGAYLVSTHEEMPNIRLSPQQVDDVVAYILSLRRH